MKLWCSKCHTLWTEAVLDVGRKCPFKDCDGHLSAIPPAGIVTPKHPKEPKTYPLLDVADER